MWWFNFIFDIVAILFIIIFVSIQIKDWWKYRNEK